LKGVTAWHEADHRLNTQTPSNKICKHTNLVGKWIWHRSWAETASVLFFVVVGESGENGAMLLI
jgi:hypothetical protein